MNVIKALIFLLMRAFSQIMIYIFKGCKVVVKGMTYPFWYFYKAFLEPIFLVESMYKKCEKYKHEVSNGNAEAEVILSEDEMYCLFDFFWGEWELRGRGVPCLTRLGRQIPQKKYIINVILQYLSDKPPEKWNEKDFIIKKRIIKPEE